MTRSKHAPTVPVSPHRRNLIAIIISFLTVSFLYLNFDPTPAGADPEAAASLAAVTAIKPIPLQPTAKLESTGEESETKQNQAPEIPGKIAEGRAALLLNLLLLEKGYEKFSKVADYTATFFKRERIDGEMKSGQIINIKVRHAPFSIYMKWIVGDRGREVLYVKGQRDGRMLVKGGGMKRFLPALKLDPNGSLAMKESRHPVTKAGVLNLVQELIGYRRKEVQLESGFQCMMLDNQEVNKRSCYGFVLEFDNRKISEVYRKSILYLDKELLIPVYLQNYTWPGEGRQISAEKLDEETIIEHYTFSNLKLDQNLVDFDFDRTNENYSLRR